jgi:hypothetical protein
LNSGAQAGVPQPRIAALVGFGAKMADNQTGRRQFNDAFAITSSYGLACSIFANLKSFEL